METDSGAYYIVISKAQGCDNIKVLDPTFIGWARKYDGPFFAEAWDPIDNDVDGFYQVMCGDDLDDCQPSKEVDDETLKSFLQWRELVMRPRKNVKGEWSYVYVTQVNGEDYTLLNKGARFLQTGQLESLRPPRAKSVLQDERVDVKWMWFDHQNNVEALHFCDQNNVEYSIRFGELVCFRHAGADITAEPIWMDTNGLVEPFSKKYLLTGFVEHVAGRQYLALPVDCVKCRDEDKLEDAWSSCRDIDHAVEPGSLDKLWISWRQGRWNCKVALDRRYEDGIWAIVHAESRNRDDNGQHSAGVGINCGEKPWLWFYVLKDDDQGKPKYVWWRCPWQIIEILETHIKSRRRRMREEALVGNGEQSAMNYERQVAELVREVEDQSAEQCEPCETGTRSYLCWICGDRRFNARQQLVDHIVGSAGKVGGKDHNKIRQQWIEAGQPMRKVWLELLEKTKNDGNTATTDAASSNTNVTHVAQAEQSVEAAVQVESLPEKSEKVGPVEQQYVQHVQQQMPVYAPRSQAAWQQEWLPQNPGDQQSVQPPPQWFSPPPACRSMSQQYQ